MSHLSFRSVSLLVLVLSLTLASALVSCDNGKGQLRLQGQFQNLDQADFLIYSPDGAFPDIDTLHLVKGHFDHQFALQGGPYTFVVIYPNYQTLTFQATERDKVKIKGDALALADVKVTGNTIPQETENNLPLNAKTKKKVAASRFPFKAIGYTPSLSGADYLLVGFWANWKGGTNMVNTQLRRALEEHPTQLHALTYSLDTDPQMYRAANVSTDERCDDFCDFRGWDSPAIRQLGIDRIPYYLLVNPQGKIVARGGDYTKDIAPTLVKLKEKD